jgi:[ribosomal protein S5]-alanine N-acetyltransferase
MLHLTLETARLQLRLPEITDCDAIQAVTNHRDVAANTLSLPYPYSTENALEFVNYARQAVMTGDAYPFAITRRDDGEIVGIINLTLRPNHQASEMGYWIGARHRNQGYATEAAGRVLLFAFDHLDLNRVHSQTFSDNPASARVLEKIGMQYEGTLRQHFIRWDEFKDAACYGVLRAEFLAGGSGE